MSKTTQDETFTYSNLRHRQVWNLLKAYVRRTRDHDLYGGTHAKTAPERQRFYQQCAVDWATRCQIMPSDMPKWWKAGAFEPEAAQALIDAGISVTLAKRSRGETGEEIDTFAYHVSMGTMSVEQVAERLLN